MNIGVVIPAFNESENLKLLLPLLTGAALHNPNNIVVVDGGNDAKTKAICDAFSVRYIFSPVKRRSVQMNLGASDLSTDILYFLHADTFPPASFASDIEAAVKRGCTIGRYHSRFLSANPLLKINAWFSQFNWFINLGGDNSLFVTAQLFENLDGFRNDLLIMEEYDFCQRAIQQGRYCIMPGSINISARKYSTNSWIKVQLANATAVRLYRKGASQEQIATTYKRMLNSY